MKFDGVILSVGDAYVVRSGPTGHLGTTYHHRTTQNFHEATIYAKWDRRGIDSSIRWAQENFPAQHIEQIAATMLTTVVIKGRDAEIDALVFEEAPLAKEVDLQNVDHAAAILIARLRRELSAAMKHIDELVAQCHDHDSRRVAAMTQASAFADEIERLKESKNG